MNKVPHNKAAKKHAPRAGLAYKLLAGYNGVRHIRDNDQEI